MIFIHKFRNKHVFQTIHRTIFFIGIFSSIKEFHEKRNCILGYDYEHTRTLRHPKAPDQTAVRLIKQNLFNLGLPPLYGLLGSGDFAFLPRKLEFSNLIWYRPIMYQPFLFQHQCPPPIRYRLSNYLNYITNI